MPAPTRPQAEAALRAARAGRPLYDDLRPAYVRLDPLIAMLRRRGFSGLLHATGKPGEGAVWFDRGRVYASWLLPADGGEVRVQRDDPLAVLRELWGDTQAVVAVRTGGSPVAAGTPPAAAPSAGAASLPPPPAATPLPIHAPGLAPSPGHLPGTPTPAGPTPGTRSKGAGVGRAARVPAAQDAAAVPDGVAVIPWGRLLPEALARIRRHRGTPLARELEAAVNVVLAPDAVLMGREVHGTIPAERAAAALQAIAAGLARVAGAAFAERLLWTLGRDFACEAAVKRLATPEEESA